MPDGTLGGGAIPGPTLETQSTAAALVAGAAARAGAANIDCAARTRSKTASHDTRRLGRARFGFLRIEPKLGDRLRDISRTVLLAQGQSV